MIFPNVIKLVTDKHIKLHLKYSKVTMFQSGTLALVAPIFGQGIYGIFDTQTNKLTLKADLWRKPIEQQKLIFDELHKVEDEGLEAIKKIGLLTGTCCVCGRTLTNENSINEGIGPICSEKMIGYGI